DKSIPVFIVEGEKDCDYLASLGLLATTNAGGAGKWRNEYNEALRDRHVIILPDNDDPGRKHAQTVASSLYGIAKSVRILELPDLPPKGDVSDWLDGGRTLEQLKTLANDAPLWKPESSQRKADPKTHFTFTTLDDLLCEPEEETAYVWDRTLPRGGFSIVSSKPKVGKSTWARNLAVAISKGLEFFGRSTVQGVVIYLCLEEKRAEVARHFRRMGASGTGIIIHTGSTPSDAFTALEAAIDEHSPALVIIDPLSRFVRVSDFNSYAEVTRGLEPLIDLARTSACQCHIMAVHHNGKGEREGGDALLGSTGFFGAVDALLIMKRRDKARTLETIQRYGEDIPETVVHLDSETGLVTPGGDMQTLQLNERKQAILDAIGEEPLSEADIKERISGNQGLTSKAVRSLFEEDRLKRSGAGKKGDPYLYFKPAENANKNSGYSGFPISTDPENLENLESSREEWNFPPDLDPEVFNQRCAEIAESQHISQREAARIVIDEHKAEATM
nr:AAA family ATPase [Acidobacteriota bacterium]